MSSHKPGSLKQSNKKHKGSGKRAQNRSFGEGRVASAPRTLKNNTSNPANDRLNRINRNNQVKKQKQTNSWLQKRIGTSNSYPKMIGILPLSDDADPVNCLEHCLYQSVWQANQPNLSDASIVHSHHAAFKTRCTFLKAPVAEERDLFAAVDIAKLADVVMFVVDARSCDMIDQAAVTMLSALKALGCPEAVFCLTGLDGTASKANLALRKAALATIERVAAFPGAKILETGPAVGGSATSQLVRSLCNLTPKTISWRAARSYMVSDRVQVAEQPPTVADGDDTFGTADGRKYGVTVSGYLRGPPMSLHSLMHVLGVGAARLVCAWGAAPGEERQSADGSKVGPAAVPATAVYADSSRQDSLVMGAVADSIAGEQTWPSEAEMLQAMDAPDSNAGRSRRTAGGAGTVIPVGMSSYQADWFQDEQGQMDFSGRVHQDGAEDGDGRYEDGGEEEEEAMAAVADDEDGDSICGGEDDGMSVAGGAFRGDQAASKQKLRGVLAADDREFPDEMQTPSDVAARVRFARYRALQSFRASPWHPKENLPQDYARIFEFENFGGTQRRVLGDCRTVEQLQDGSVLRARSAAKSSSGAKSVASRSQRQHAEDQMMMDDEEEDKEQEQGEAMGEEDGDHEGGGGLLVAGAPDFIRSGQFVHLQLADVPEDVVARLQSCGYLALFGLHQHEQKTSVLHMSVQRTADNQELVKSKDPLLFQVGFRSFTARPVFSESNLNCDKHKFERFLLHDRFSMASCFGPVTYSPSPVLIFQRSAATGRLSLVATGSLSKVDPDRIMLKKIILTGIPIRVRKKYAVVRHMFYEPMDVRWFRPAELVTKHGLRGHIKEPIGTHGLLKAYFSGPIKQNDTVMLILYKRVFPKFAEEGLVVK